MRPTVHAAFDALRGTHRITRLVIAMTLALSLPALALASHQFTDVPTSSPFHNNISNLVEAGITAGCGSGKYCPKSAVTREQMAAFMTRGLGRSAESFNGLDFADADSFYVTQVTIAAGGATGGTGFIHVTANVLADTSTDGECPCAVTFAIVDIATGEVSPVSGFVVSDTSFDGERFGSGTTSWVFESPTNKNRTFALSASVTTTSGATGFLNGMMTAVYTPFGSGGGSTLEVQGGSTAPSLPGADRVAAPKR